MLEEHRKRGAAAKDWPHKPEIQRQINLMPDVWRIASQLDMTARVQGFNVDLLYPKADIDWIKRLHVVANKRVHLTNLALLTISELPAGSLDDCEEVLNRFRGLAHGAALERIPFNNHTSQTKNTQ